MKTFVDFHSIKWVTPVWLVLYLCSLLLLWYKRKEWKKGYDLFFWLAIGGILVAYCPLTFKLLVPGFLPGFGTYERLCWILFVIPVMAYVVVSLTKEQPTRRKSALFVMAFIALMLTIGHLNNWQWYGKPENKYKISQDAVDVTEIIREDSGDDNVIVAVQLIDDLTRKNDQYEDYLLLYGMRQYESHFYMSCCIVPPSSYDKEGFTLDGKLYRRTDYFVGPKDIDCITREMDRLGFVQIGETGKYRILRNQALYDERQAAKGETP